MKVMKLTCCRALETVTMKGTGNRVQKSKLAAFLTRACNRVSIYQEFVSSNRGKIVYLITLCKNNWSRNFTYALR